MEFNNLLYELNDGIATVFINRPKSLNSLNSETVAEIDAVFTHIADDDNVKGVILAGAGSKSFVAGADISELAEKDPIAGRDFAYAGQAALNKIELLQKPVIAAVNGFALGGGCEIAMACHMRVASTSAKFGQPEVGLGLIPGFGGTQRLPRLVGKGRALELLLGGGIIDAMEAYRIGLVNCVLETNKVDEEGNPEVNEKGKPIFDADKFLAEVTKMLQGFLSKAPVALAYVIDAVNRGLDTDLGAGLKIEADLFGMVYATEDSKEGTSAFLAKREANFKGK